MKPSEYENTLKKCIEDNCDIMKVKGEIIGKEIIDIYEMVVDKVNDIEVNRVIKKLKQSC